MDDEDREEAPDSLLEALAATPAGEVVPRGTVIDGQYRVERVLGEGGMGVVYLARDQRLDREVAIKIGIERSAASIGRLAREALALARLSHPNVVVIYQVGEIEGRSYVAMEYVQGGTARRWVEGKGWREIVGLYVAAGDGLAAAHAAGLIHRDFKPDNVLVGTDGRPRVADFGLARVDALVGGDGGGEAKGATGVLGTPAYMAPEQIAAAELDARADQFAFCVSVWEALFGERPFAERTTERDGAARELVRPAAKKMVPKHVEAALRRGMAAKREERWERMEDLLHELRRDPARRRTALVGAGAALAVGAGAVVLVLARGSGAATEDPCGGGEARIARVWSPARAAAVRANLAPPGAPPWVAEEAARAVATIDQWAARWSGEYRVVCEAGRGAWSRSLADRGVACLAERQRELVAAADVLATGTNLRGRVERVADRLGAPERCGDAAFLAAAVPPPEDPVTARAVEARGAELAKAEALIVAGKTEAGRALLPPISEAAQKLAYKPLIARALFVQGNGQQLVEDNAAALTSFHDCYFTARAGRDPQTATGCAASAAIALLDLSRDPEAAEWARLAEVEAAVAADPLAEGRAMRALVLVTKSHGDPKQALAYAERYVALARAQSRDLLDALQARAEVRDQQGDYDAALADLDEAMRVVRSRYTEHPTEGEIERARSLVLVHMRKVPEAVAAARHGVEIAERMFGKDSENALDAVGFLATALKDAHQFDEARAMFQRTMLADAPNSYNLASDLNNLGDLESQAKNPDKALALLEQAGTVFGAVVGPESYEVGMVELNIWNALYDNHRPVAPAAARAALALKIMGKTPDSPIYGQALIASGITDLAAGDLAHAKEHLALGLEKIGGDTPWKMRALIAQGKIRIAEKDVPGARQALSAARAAAQEAGQNETLAEIDRMLGALR